MDDSPAGREIEEVKGNPSGIIKRGEAITDLGEQMREAAHKLEGMKNNSLEFGGQEGKAIDSLAESIGDSYEVLFKAADLYQPVGPVITAYGNELEDVQPLIKSAVGDCESLWETYQSLPGDVEPRGTGGLFEPDADSPEADAQAKEDQAKKQAYDEWKSRAEDFDSHYDTWESAFDDAVTGVTDGTSGSIEDSFWSTLTDILEVVALIVGIAALIIGGPIMAAIALAVAAALLLTTTMSYLNGERSMTDIVFAAIGVIPFGNITKVSGLAKGAQVLRGGNAGKVASELSGLKGLQGMTKYADDLMTKGPLKTIMAGDGLIGTLSQKGAAKGLTKVFTGSERGFTDTYRFHKQLFEGAGPTLAAMRNGKGTLTLAGIDFASTAFATTQRNVKYLSMAIPGTSFSLNLPEPANQFVG